MSGRLLLLESDCKRTGPWVRGFESNMSVRFEGLRSGDQILIEGLRQDGTPRKILLAVADGKDLISRNGVTHYRAIHQVASGNRINVLLEETCLES